MLLRRSATHRQYPLPGTVRDLPDTGYQTKGGARDAPLFCTLIASLAKQQDHKIVRNLALIGENG